LIQDRYLIPDRYVYLSGESIETRIFFAILGLSLCLYLTFFYENDDGRNGPSIRNHEGMTMIEPNSLINVISKNWGEIHVLDNSSIRGIYYNFGNIVANENSRIGEIDSNAGDVTVHHGSRIGKIKNNIGVIYLYGNVEVESLEEGGLGRVIRRPERRW